MSDSAFHLFVQTVSLLGVAGGLIYTSVRCVIGGTPNTLTAKEFVLAFEAFEFVSARWFALDQRS